MVARVLISPSACRVSKSGIAVSPYTAQSDLIVDFLNNQYAGVLVAGVIPFSALSVANSTFVLTNDTQIYSYTVYYGKTLAGPPEVLWGCSDGTYLYPYYMFDQTATTGTNFIYNRIYTQAVVSNAYATFSIKSTYAVKGMSATRWPYQFNISYYIFQV